MNNRWSPEARKKFTSPMYRIWSNMKARCYTKSSSRYANYGGRGIRVCDRWLESFDIFCEDMGPRPTSEHQIDRIDNDGDYEPSNCRWALRIEQARNRSTTRLITSGGETKCLQEWAQDLSVNPQTIADRLDRGWDKDKAVSTEARSVSQPGAVFLTYNGKTQRLYEWAKECGLSSATLCKRLKRGWSASEAIEIPNGGKRSG